MSLPFNPPISPPPSPERSLQLHWRDALRQQQEDGNAALDRAYNIAKLVKIKHQRRFWSRVLIEYGIYTLFLAFIYLVLVGVPLWRGTVYWLYWLMQNKFVFQGGWAIVLAVLIFYTYISLLLPFEPNPPPPEYYLQRNISPNPAATSQTTALLIPTYRSAPILSATLTAALKTFPAPNIYIVANGNSSTPLDNTEEICRSFGVNHIWSPVGSKIVALFVGCYAVKRFASVLVMDDDCILPEGFIVVSSRLNEKTKCIGYTIKASTADTSTSTSTSTQPAPDGTVKETTWVQKAQDLEYKLAGLQRCFAAKVGSATFAHGAIALWDRAFLQETLEHHPGFAISEDWFLGDSCRRLGGRVGMCSVGFVETGVPDALIFPNKERETNGDGDGDGDRRGGSGSGSGRERGGFGETTVFRQRFERWNFFTPTGVWHNVSYIFGSWKLGRWEVGTKVFVFQEVYETILYLCTPFILPISLAVRPWFCIEMSLAILGLYLLHVLIFNEIHLRMKGERVSLLTVFGYYTPYKMFMSLINVGSCYWALFKYGQYFAQRHPKLTEDHKAVGLVLTLEEAMRSQVVVRDGRAER